MLNYNDFVSTAIFNGIEATDVYITVLVGDEYFTVYTEDYFISAKQLYPGDYLNQLTTDYLHRVWKGLYDEYKKSFKRRNLNHIVGILIDNGLCEETAYYEALNSMIK